MFLLFHLWPPQWQVVWSFLQFLEQHSCKAQLQFFQQTRLQRWCQGRPRGWGCCHQPGAGVGWRCCHWCWAQECPELAWSPSELLASCLTITIQRKSLWSSNVSEKLCQENQYVGSIKWYFAWSWILVQKMEYSRLVIKFIFPIVWHLISLKMSRQEILILA